MKEQLVALLLQAVKTLQTDGLIPSDLPIDIQLTRSKSADQGDFATNIAMILAKPAGLKPRELAEKIIASLPQSDHIQSVEIAGPGFINLFLKANTENDALTRAIAQGDEYGKSALFKNKRIHIEFVSANPTGPLHVGHGRGAAFGATVSNLLEAIGYSVHREYYVNDAGRQMRNLAISVWLRYLELYQRQFDFPQNIYRGDYVVDISTLLQEKYGEQFLLSPEKVNAVFPKNIDAEKDPEKYVDQLVENAIQAIGNNNFEIIRQCGIDEVLSDIKNDLSEFGVHYNNWFLESELYQKKWLEAGLALLKKHNFTYEKDGAIWFRATDLGDEKDRVLVRQNGQPTYFASDVAYHTYKYDQNYNLIIDVFGADHHGYLPRINAFLKGLGKNTDLLKILLVQFAILYRGDQKISMSTRAGEFVTLRELRNEVGNDAARFFYIMRKPDQHLDFDLELAKSTSNENPVYYIQYAHARICSVWRQLAEKNIVFDKADGLKHLDLLTQEAEKNLITAIASYPEIILSSAEQYAPHKLANFLQTFAHHFHQLYNSHKFIIDDENLRNARLSLILAAQIVLQNGLKLLGVFAPESM